MTMVRHCLFFALKPPAVEAARIGRLAAQLRAEHGLSGRPLRDERFHITLVHLGTNEQPPDPALVGAARRAGESLAWPAFELAFDQLLSFGRGEGHHPWVLGGGAGLDGVRALHASLVSGLAREGLRPGRQRYVPHLTLLYDERSLAPQALAVPGWRADELQLIDSLQGLTRHELLGRWPARG